MARSPRTGVWSFVIGLIMNKKKVCKRLFKKFPSQKAKEKEMKLEAYRDICMMGFTSMFWKDVNGLLTNLQKEHQTASSFISVLATYSQFAMALGVLAAALPKTARYPMVVAANGALQYLLFVIGMIHLEVLGLCSYGVMKTSWLLTTGAFIAYWGFSVDEVTLPIAVLKGFLWVICFLGRLLSFGFNKVSPSAENPNILPVSTADTYYQSGHR